MNSAWSRREPQIAARQVLAERVRDDADRPDCVRMGMALAIGVAVTDPDDRAHIARGCHHPVADAQRFDRDLACGRRDAGSRDVARGDDIRRDGQDIRGQGTNHAVHRLQRHRLVDGAGVAALKSSVMLPEMAQGPAVRSRRAMTGCHSHPA